MKRSRSVRLTLIGAATAGSLAACDSQPATPPAFSDIAACTAAGYTEDSCKTSYEKALKEHQDKAPRFSNKEECLKSVDVTDCAPIQVKQADGSMLNMFVPLMAGYMLANVVQRMGGGGSYGGYYGGPVYNSRYYGSTYRDLDDVRTTRPSGGVFSRPSYTPSYNRPANVGTTTISRGGFGSSFSSFGGSSS